MRFCGCINPCMSRKNVHSVGDHVVENNNSISVEALWVRKWYTESLLITLLARDGNICQLIASDRSNAWTSIHQLHVTQIMVITQQIPICSQRNAIRSLTTTGSNEFRPGNPPIANHQAIKCTNRFVYPTSSNTHLI